MNELTDAEDAEVQAFLEWLRTLTAARREIVFYELHREICPHCGDDMAERGRCYCQARDRTNE